MTAVLLLLLWGVDGGTSPATPPVGVTQPAGAGISAAQQRELVQVAMLLKYVAGDYPAIVVRGRITDAKEFKEMQAFTALARTEVAALTLAGPQARQLATELRRLEADVARRADAAAIGARINGVTALLGTAFGVSARFAPDRTPDVREGERIFRQNCAVCHGVSGNGRGPAALKLNPHPANLTDRDFMRMESPFSVFSTVNVGVADAAMPAWHGILSDQEIWNVVFYVWRFHLDPASIREGQRLLGRTRPKLPAPDAYLNASDDELAAELAPAADPAGRTALADYLRTQPALVLAGRSAARAADTLDLCRHTLARVRELVHAGSRTEALEAAVEAYLNGFEPVETDLGARAPALKRDIEERFGRLREQIQAGVPEAGIGATLDEIEAGLHQAGRATETGLSGTAALGQSFVIIVREGFEIILVLAALATYLIRIGKRDQTLWLYAGAAAAVLASFLVAWLAEWALSITPVSQEALEGITMLLAAGVLFFMSHWILSRIQAEKWNKYIQQTASRAIKSGSLWTLAGVGFLVVFREGVETVLFYQSLVFGSPDAGQSIWIGFGLGCFALLLISIAMYQLGLRLPLRPFFVATSALLYVLVFSFTGQGIHELQAGGLLPVTAWRWLPSLPLLGVHPTLESFLPQAILLGIGLFGLRAMRRAGGTTAPLTGVVQPTIPGEQFMAVQKLASQLRTELEAGPAGPAQLEAWRNLARQIEAATRSVEKG